MIERLCGLSRLWDPEYGKKVGRLAMWFRRLVRSAEKAIAWNAALPPLIKIDQFRNRCCAVKQIVPLSRQLVHSTIGSFISSALPQAHICPSIHNRTYTHTQIHTQPPKRTHTHTHTLICTTTRTRMNALRMCVAFSVNLCDSSVYGVSIHAFCSILCTEFVAIAVPQFWQFVKLEMLISRF